MRPSVKSRWVEAPTHPLDQEAYLFLFLQSIGFMSKNAILRD